ncbi:MAG: MATE family efflux transporter, partial [Muribaculaceae bacterium]|nr:MATE family efflux transporter [Muribaculaceae bacterium]
EELIHLTGRTLSVCMSMMIIVGYQITSTNFFQSLGMASRSIFMSLTRQVLFLIPSLFILPEIFGLAGVWMSFPVADGISTFVTMLLTIQILRKISRLQSTQTNELTTK